MNQRVEATMGFVSTSKLAKMLDTPKSDLSEAVRNERACAGHPVWQWAEQGEDGEIYGFEVPQELLQDLARERDLSTGLLGF